MNRVDLHPEQLFDRLRMGAITRDEYELLQTHCHACTACRLELSLVFEPMSAPVPDSADRALGISVVDRMFHTTQASVKAPRRAGGRVPRARSVAFIAAGVVLGCSMTAAALVPDFPLAVARAVSDLVGLSAAAAPTLASSHAARPRPSSGAQLLEPSVATSPGSVEMQPTSTPDAALAAADAALESALPRERRASDESAAKRASAKGAAIGARPPHEGADWLLAAAARARARGDYAEAADYYRMLQRHYPNTEAEIVARVSLGRLLCLRLGRPKAALELFEGYLSQRPHGALEQEARSGRALCLERLGRKQAARSAWEDLVVRYPSSVYADEARVRLAEP